MYRKAPPHVWALIRIEWESGDTVAGLSRRHGVPGSTIRHRRNTEGWAQRSPLERLAEPAAQPLTPLRIAEAALNRAVEALAQGRAADAVALIKAGDAVGVFADFVAGLRAAEARTPATPLMLEADA